MMRYAVVGASSGTGLAIVRHLASKRTAVRAISRHPPQAGPFVEPVVADVTDIDSISKALARDFRAVFFTVDIHGLFNSRQRVRELMYQGCVNTITAVSRSNVPSRFVLLSVIGPDQPSWVWLLLNAVKRGMRRNILDREKALEDSGLPYIICRAPRLNDELSGTAPLAATPPQHRLDMKMGISRIELARAMILAADEAPARTTWDVFADVGGSVPLWLRTLPDPATGAEA